MGAYDTVMVSGGFDPIHKGHVRMILELQQSFGIRISHDKIAELTSVKKISDFLKDKNIQVS